MENLEWFIEGIESDGKSYVNKIESTPFSIGRLKDSNLSLSVSTVSRKHAVITESRGDYFIEDCNSTNGTLVNGRIIQERVRLRNGDIITIGNFEFKVISQEREEDLDRTIITSNKKSVNTFGDEFNLTPREIELLSYLSKGVTTKEIAESMFISPGTAKNHVLNLLKKTNTHSRVELITKFNNY